MEARRSMMIWIGSLILVMTTAAFPLLWAQEKNPVDWHFSAVRSGVNEAEITMTAILDQGWYIYSAYLNGNGPMPTQFRFEWSGDFELVGKIREATKPVESFDPIFLIPVLRHDRKAVFTQKIKLINKIVVLSGSVLFMAGDGIECLMPEERVFTLKINGT